MKYLKKTNSEFEFNFVQNPANTEYVQTTVYTRTQEEYDELVEIYNSDPEASNYVFPKRILSNNKKKEIPIEMEYSIIDYNGYKALKVKITKNTTNYNLQDYVLCVETQRKRYTTDPKTGNIAVLSKNKSLLYNLYEYTFDVSNIVKNNFYKMSPILDDEYIFYICPTNKYMKRGTISSNSLGLQYGEFNCKIKIRPCLRHKNQININESNSPYIREYVTIQNQEFINLECKLNQFININNY